MLLNIVMSFESNSGSVYYPLSCGVPSDPGVDIESNNFTGYLYKEANDFILWGQEDYYEHPQTNIGTEYYFLQCNVPSDPDLDLESNSGTKFYYSSAFNCVSFCEGVTPAIFFILNSDGTPAIFFILNSDGTDRLVRPIGDTTTTNIIAPDGTLYNVEP